MPGLNPARAEASIRNVQLSPRGGTNRAPSDAPLGESLTEHLHRSAGWALGQDRLNGRHRRGGGSAPRHLQGRADMEFQDRPDRPAAEPLGAPDSTL